MQKLSPITSRDNPKFKHWMALLTRDGIREHKKCIVSGRKLALEESKNSESHLWIATEALAEQHGALWEAQNLCLVSPELFRELDVFGTRFPLLVRDLPQVCEVVDLPADQPAVLLPLQDPTNFGAAVRNCLAFGVRNVVCIPGSASPFLPKSIRSSSGAVFRAQLFSASTAGALHSFSPLYGLDMVGINVRQAIVPSNFRLMLGEEGRGLPADFQGERLTIPMDRNAVESLNAATALAVALALLRRS